MEKIGTIACSQIMGAFEGKHVCQRICAKEHKRENNKRECQGSISFWLWRVASQSKPICKYMDFLLITLCMSFL